MKDLEAQAHSALARMRRGKRETKPGALPGDKTPFVWRVLSGTEKQECLAAAADRFRELNLPVELRMHSDLEDEVVWQILFLAMRDAASVGDASEPFPVPFAASVDELRDLLSVDERDLLASEYLDFEDDVNPDPAKLHPELFDAIAEAAKKKDRAVLNSFGSH